jgi:hypothetical protein
MPIALALLAAVAAVDPATAPLDLRSPVQDKNFYFLSLLERNAALVPAIPDVAAAKRGALEKADPAGLRFTEDEIAQAAEALAPLAPKLAETMRRSGVFIRHHAMNDSELVKIAWREAAAGVNRAIAIFALGTEKPRYPLIDSPMYDLASPTGKRLIQLVAGVTLDDPAALSLFFQPSLRFAIGMMNANLRDEAGRHEPMDQGENRAAVNRAKGIRWRHYPYTVIVVPGAGSDRPGLPLSPWGKLRVQLAAKRYRDRQAPFILVSGGYVHPNQTPYAEAIEMKKALMNDFGIPADAIFIDPHARHTTTNLRNAARLIYRYGLPFGQRALITTDPGQSGYIESAVFTKRCADELGYQPHADLKRLNPFDLEFNPRIESLYADPVELLDP